jgi:hypothetical protein
MLAILLLRITLIKVDLVYLRKNENNNNNSGRNISGYKAKHLQE